MPLRALMILMAVLVAACAGGGTDLDASPAPPSSPVTTEPAAEPAKTSTAALAETRPVWEGFAATSQSSSNLAVHAEGPVDVYESPGDAVLEMTLEETTILGTTTVLAVVTPPEDGWVEVMLPIRPNGSTGWVQLDNVSLYAVDGEIVVDLAKRTLSYVVDGVKLVETEVGIGSEHNQTPTGRFFVTDNVTLADPNSPWGPHALGISARSDTITEFNGGDGIVGIHGTNNPTSIGNNVSLGCVRVPNDMITLLHELVPLGTPVEVRG